MQRQTMPKKVLFAVLAVWLSAVLTACGGTGPGSPEDTGRIRAALVSGLAHDVTAIEYKVVPGGSGCDAAAVAQSTVPLEAETLPGAQQPPGGGDQHRFADALFVLPPGIYHVCATPLAGEGPSADCAPAEGDGTVVAESTAEILLVSQCKGSPNGGLDVVTILNDPPRIDGLKISESKFITTCEKATISVSASDANHDALTYAWTIVSAPAGSSASLVASGATAVFDPDLAGDYTLKVTVTDVHGGTTSLSFPIHVSSARCGLSGETGTTWQLVAESHRGLQAWVPSGDKRLFAGSGLEFGVYDLTSHAFTALASPPTSLAAWGSPALSAGAIWELRTPDIVRFDPGTNTWTTVRSDLHLDEDHAMTVTADDTGNLWSHNNSGEIVRYDPVTDTITYFPTGLGAQFETRLGFDGPSNAIYFGGFATSNLFKLDIATGTVTARASIPEGGLNDIFCSDHNGHIYAAGGFSGTTMWQYRVDSDTWVPIPDLPADHGINGSCGVVADGFLYVENSFTSASGLYRLELF